MQFSPRLLVSAFMLSGVANLAEPVHAQECLADWGIAGEIVRRQGLVTVDEVAREILPGGRGQILKSTLCRKGTGYVYKVVVRDGKGQLRSMVVPAQRQPEEQGSGEHGLEDQGDAVEVLPQDPLYKAGQ